MSTTVHVEFTIEPFIEGDPGRHVTAAIEAVQALGIAVELGPFSSSFTTTTDNVGDVIKVLLDAAYRNGATHVNLHAENQ